MDKSKVARFYGPQCKNYHLRGCSCL